MKKSTIFILAIVYILSVVIVGFFGASIRASNIYVYVESIVLSDPTNTQLVLDESKSIEGKYYYFETEFAPTNGIYTVSLKAQVKPIDANEQLVEPLIAQNKDYTVTSLEENIFQISFTRKHSITGSFRARDTHRASVQFTIKFK